MALSTHTPSENEAADRRPCIMVCNWSQTDPVWDLVEDLSGVPWQPDGVRTELVEPHDDIDGLAADLARRLLDQEARALLLIGRTRHDGAARLQLRTEIPQRDGERISHDAPGIARTTAPAGQIIEAITKNHISIVASSDNEDDEGSRLLYKVLTRLNITTETPSVALLRFPPSMPEAMVAQAVKSATVVMTQHLTPLPRLSPTR